MTKVTRVPVKFDYTGLNPEFLKCMAEIVSFADEKYGTWTLYTEKELVGQASPINHAIEHLMQYQRGEPYDHFDGDARRHLVAAAYNCMMSFFYAGKFGWKPHPLVLEHRSPIKKLDMGSVMANMAMGTMLSAVVGPIMDRAMAKKPRKKRKKKGKKS